MIIDDADFSREALWDEAHKQGLNRKDCVTIGINDSLGDLKRYIALDTSLLSQQETCINVMQIICKNLENSSAPLDALHYLMNSLPIENNKTYYSSYTNYRSLMPHYMRLITKRYEFFESSFNFILNANRMFLKLHFFYELSELLVKIIDLDPPNSMILQVQAIEIFKFMSDYTRRANNSLTQTKHSNLYMPKILSREAVASLANSLRPYLAHSQAPEKNIVYGGVELGHTLSSAITSPPTSLDLIAHFNYISPGQRPLWLNHLARMSLGTLFTYDGREFKEIKTTSSPIAIQPTTCHETDMHVFEIITDNLASRTIGNHCYVLPISHPELQLVSCHHGAIFVDEFDRWILQTTNLKKATVTLGIHKSHDSTILNHVIDKDNFQSYERALASSEAWAIWNIISNYFRDDKKTSSNPDDIVSLGYSGCNEKNISCLNRAKELQKKLQLNPYCYLVRNGAHAFLLVKHGKQQFLIDAGGAAVPLNYLSNTKTEKKAISSVASKKHSSLYLTSYQTLLEAFIESFKKKWVFRFFCGHQLALTNCLLRKISYPCKSRNIL